MAEIHAPHPPRKKKKKKKERKEGMPEVTAWSIPSRGQVKGREPYAPCADNRLMAPVSVTYLMSAKGS